MATKKAHILTDRQLRGTLASVKKKPRLPKNVLIRNEDDYWPALNETQRETFVKLLETFCLQTVDYKHQLTIGLHSTLASLKQENAVKIVVLTSEFSPRMIAKHLLSMTFHLNQKMKVFIVPKLKELTNKLMEVPTIILAFKSSAKSSEPLESFYDQLEIHSELLRQYLVVKPVQDVSIKKKKKVKAMQETPVVLLTKINESTRSFIPMETDLNESKPPAEFILPSKHISSDFIALSKYSDNSNSTLPLPLYRPIKIKKVIGNLNRKLKKSWK